MRTRESIAELFSRMEEFGATDYLEVLARGRDIGVVVDLGGSAAFLGVEWGLVHVYLQFHDRVRLRHRLHFRNTFFRHQFSIQLIFAVFFSLVGQILLRHVYLWWICYAISAKFRIFVFLEKMFGWIRFQFRFGFFLHLGLGSFPLLFVMFKFVFNIELLICLFEIIFFFRCLI